ncbi:MAG: hypothetical protein QNJ64_20770 [Crocosphaera sp.]|nr:hypothetical protein [Crocosphaera sp.]
MIQRREDVTRPNIGINQREENTNLDVVSAKRGSKNLATGHEIEIHGPCRIVYRPEKPHTCGATVWIETLATATVFDFDGSVYRVDSRWMWEEEEMWKINKINIDELCSNSI